MEEPTGKTVRTPSLSAVICLCVGTVGGALWLWGDGAEPIGQVLVGVVLLLAGGTALVDGSVTLARRLGVSTLVIGLTLVAFGTSAPELAFNIVAAANGDTDLSFGNVIGSNIANIGLVLGLCALIFSPVAVHGRVIRRELPLLLLVSAGLLALSFFGWSVVSGPESVRGVARPEGALLLGAFAVFTFLWYRLGRRSPDDLIVIELEEEEANQPKGTPPSMPFAVFLCVAGLAALAGGGQLSEAGAVGIAEWFGASQRYVGLTVIAIATSLPEVFASLTACRRGHHDLAIGNVVGSNMFNILLVLGTTALVRPVGMPDGGAADLGVMMAMTLALMLFARARSNAVNRIEGVVLVVGYVSYLVWAAMA